MICEPAGGKIIVLLIGRGATAVFDAADDVDVISIDKKLVSLNFAQRGRIIVDSRGVVDSGRDGASETERSRTLMRDKKPTAKPFSGLYQCHNNQKNRNVPVHLRLY